MDEETPIASTLIREGDQSETYSSALASTGHIRVNRQEWKEAEPILREGLAIGRKPQPEAWTTFFAQFPIGVSLMGQDQHAEAQPLLVAGRNRVGRAPWNSGGDRGVLQRGRVDGGCQPGSCSHRIGP